jgi:hypothetical protein
MKSWFCIAWGLLAVLGLEAQAPIALLDFGPAAAASRFAELEESSASFDLRGGLIFVNAVVDGKQGRYVIDTGAPGLVLNQAPQEGGDWSGNGVTGCVGVEETMVEQFVLGNARFAHLNAYKVDLAYLEQSLGCEIDGLIGYEVLREMELVLDYPNRTITLLPLRKSDPYQDEREGFLDFFLINHIPVVSGKLGKKDILLGVDTGAGANVLRLALGRSFEASASGKNRVRGTDSQVKMSSVVKAPVDIEGYEEEMAQEYLLMDLSHLQSDLDRPIDGLLGFPFLQDGKWSIHYGQQRIYFWKK